ncbi:ligase-associated DNA damage response exonuclease [Roseibium litorale]|uniref:Ligase-associated DNA damage response exonuclease n=1 Tax=Roseibium litorale TaxID=2803841 RepID=A0ABR9CQN6_9HYPH|nr:ligase-associated DNA damage response exonuclease [Roseibium litorale]MBD8893176.1 ligase-associated DNA damage response exonuclease [Roseibium litorale]
MSNLLTLTPEGLYVPRIDAHIDPVRPVARALITHGHADHARAGHGAVLATRQTLDILAIRYGEECCASAQALDYGERLQVSGVTISLHPAGHVLGSAQIRLEDTGGRTVISGDYKRQADPTCAPFELVRCDTFVTEATFGLPVFRHPPAGDEVRKLLRSLELFPEKVHLVGAYALGKAQRLIGELRAAGYEKTIYLHGALVRLTHYYQSQGVEFGDIEVVGSRGKELAGRIVLCPPGELTGRWSRRFGDCVTAVASGWMRVRARARQRGAVLPLVISDHADWDDLCRTIEETGAGQVWVTHGAEEALVYWCETHGRKARPLNMIGYGDGEEADGPVHVDAQAGAQNHVG